MQSYLTHDCQSASQSDCLAVCLADWVPISHDCQSAVCGSPSQPHSLPHSLTGSVSVTQSVTFTA
eukprot:849139-Lingulodinium_polyedra.AAC.1